MSQLWAIVDRSGQCVFRYTDSIEHSPIDFGHADECDRAQVWPLDREPQRSLGEMVSAQTGVIIFSAQIAADDIIPAIKQAAEYAILEVSPIWRQINDLAEPETPGAAARHAVVKALRQQSNDLEQLAALATSAADLAAVWAEITKLRNKNG
jgi:hypothetical protein